MADWLRGPCSWCKAKQKKNGDFCSKSCSRAYHVDVMNRYPAKIVTPQQVAAAPSPVVAKIVTNDRPCPVCQEQIKGNAKRRFCSDACKQAAYRERVV